MHIDFRTCFCAHVLMCVCSVCMCMSMAPSTTFHRSDLEGLRREGGPTLRCCCWATRPEPPGHIGNLPSNLQPLANNTMHTMRLALMNILMLPYVHWILTTGCKLRHTQYVQEANQTLQPLYYLTITCLVKSPKPRLYHVPRRHILQYICIIHKWGW